MIFASAWGEAPLGCAVYDLRTGLLTVINGPLTVYLRSYTTPLRSMRTARAIGADTMLLCRAIVEPQSLAGGLLTRVRRSIAVVASTAWQRRA
jgi:hypothetical protein